RAYPVGPPHAIASTESQVEGFLAIYLSPLSVEFDLFLNGRLVVRRKRIQPRMSIVATVESLWRYPVKSMRGEELDEMFAGYSGVYGDRLFAFKSSASPKGFPYLTGREQRQMLRYRPRFRPPEQAARP